MKTKPIKDPKMVESRLKVRKYTDDTESMHAEGGEVSANNEKRAMPEDLHNDKKEKSALKRSPLSGSGSKDENSAEHASLDSEVDMERGSRPEADRALKGTPVRRSYIAPDDDEFMDDMQMLADGGDVMDIDSDEQPQDEMEEEQDGSIASAIMAKHARKMMALGGEILKHSNASDILSDDSLDSDSSSEVDLSRNADEDANEEDQASYNALRKENYSESDSLDELHQPKNSNEDGDSKEDSRSDKRDRVGAIMNKMSRKKR